MRSNSAVSIRILPKAVLSIALLTIGCLLLSNRPANGQSSTDATATPLIFPTVPSAGISLQVDRIYVHPTGLFSLAHVSGWDLSPNREESKDATSAIQVARAGVTFINRASYSVILAYVEHDVTDKIKTLADLDKSYDKVYFDAAWANFTGGYKEVSRSTQNNLSVINFTLSLNNSIFLGRQISQLGNGWVKSIRLVAPENNPGLMDSLQKTEWSSFRFYPAESTLPLAWPSILDPVAGYLVRYLPDWSQTIGAPGQTYSVAGMLHGLEVTLTTNVESVRAVKGRADVLTWVGLLDPKARIQSIQQIVLNGNSGFNVSYQTTDPSGSAESAISTLINARGNLYTVTITLATATNALDLLAKSGIPTELAQVRSSLILIPTSTAASLVSSPTPANTTETTPSKTLDAASLDFSTAKLFKSDDDVFEILLPAGWRSAEPSTQDSSRSWVFYDGSDQSSAPASIQFQLIDAKIFYQNLDPTGKVNSPTEAFQTIIDQSNQPGNLSPKFGEISNTRIGNLSGKALTADIPDSAQGPEALYDLRIVQVNSTQVLYVVSRTDAGFAVQTTPLFEKMLASVVINIQNVPTATITPTLPPLLFTATAFEATIEALTPTDTITATPTITPTLLPILRTATAFQSTLSALTGTATPSATRHS